MSANDDRLLFRTPPGVRLLCGVCLEANRAGTGHKSREYVKLAAAAPRAPYLDAHCPKCGRVSFFIFMKLENDRLDGAVLTLRFFIKSFRLGGGGDVPQSQGPA